MDTAAVVAEIAAVLDGRHADIRGRVRDELVPRAGMLAEVEELSRADYRERVREVLVETAGTGLTGLGFPTEYGGGGDIGASIAAFETLAMGDLSVLVKTGVQFGLFGGAILHLGTKRHHDAYLSDVVAGRLLGCFAMTEHGHGSNVAELGTTATYDPETDELVVTTSGPDAYKDYIGNAAAHGQMAAVFANLVVGGESHGVHAVLVPIRVDGSPAPGVRIADDGPKMGLNGVDNGRLWFDEVRVPRANLLNRFADITDDGRYESSIENPNRRFFTMLGTLVQGRVSVGGAGITASKAALAIATRYAARRRQFGTGEGEEMLLLDYGQHQRRLIPLIARSYALSFAQDELREQLHEIFSADPETVEEHRRRELESRAAGTKALATWHATRAIQECREACGGAGYLAENRFAALKADTDVFMTFEGDNTVLLQLVAKGLLTDYAGSFEDLDQLGMVRFVAGMAVDTVLERTSAHKLLERVRDLLPGGDSWDQEAEIRDPEYHLAMLRFREEHMLGGVARRLKRGVDNGGDAAEVFSAVQDHVIASARAHVERLVLEAFVARVEKMAEGPARELLAQVCTLHALAEIERDRAWFMEHGRLTIQRSKAISREVGALCRELRTSAVDLVNAFGVPDELLRAEDLIG
ncbi:acyl-CoA dehydrogenase family protein [Nocardioides nematodiphilus]|uniref:acyl-CoA dehydrogenase family protein n=1 Tax=Nocardioides nematodiphilus TaxID=2849669 RepID=UPI001CDA313C|nr:acyl-CoA dehydrogenase [Nocardioides nematodiphilus]MCA1981643.1 acyl-CoA dehydrogenase family protein [Nocardioides nematodiphilus]